MLTKQFRELNRQAQVIENHKNMVNKQETLEEALLRIGLMEIELNHTKTLLASCEKALENRDNQAERMYSKEDMQSAIQFGKDIRSEKSFINDNFGSPFIDYEDSTTEIIKWFEQFKKK
jgi:hypothetical protein